MIILLGSKNPSKRNALEKALLKLNISDYEIIQVDAKSNTSSKPIGFEIIRGAENRNLELKEYAQENNITYDYLCSIEGGFSVDENGLPFVVTYCVTEDINGKKSTGKSLGVRLTRAMYRYVREGGSLNKLIEKINKESNNKQKLGITGYLTNGLYSREDVDSDSVVSSLIPFIYKEEKDTLNKYVLQISNELK